MSGYEPGSSTGTGQSAGSSTSGASAGAQSSSTTRSARFKLLAQRAQATRAYKAANFGWRWRRPILFGFGATYALVRYLERKEEAIKRDWVHDKTYLYWKVYDGAIVEAKSTGSNLNYLLSSSSGSPEEPARVMTLWETLRTLMYASADNRIHGIIADFSSTSVPAVPSYTLGLAQLEDIQEMLLELKKKKQAELGDRWRSIAMTDSFSSQGQYLLASAFDEVYMQPTGDVPLVGMGGTIPFFGKLARWLGIDVHAEARNEYKSFVQPYIDEKFTEPQRANQHELINDLNDQLMTYLGRNRYPNLSAQEALAKMKHLSQSGPYNAREALEHGLITGIGYRQDVLDSVMKEDEGGDPERKLKGFYHYAKTTGNYLDEQDATDIGIVYLLGTIGEPGEFGTASVIRGLKEAGEDDSISSVILRLDTGGGAVVDSDTIWAGVRDLQRKGKTVIASFGNSCASGGYLVSTHADAILASPSTITGSIGVASLRPTVLQTFLDRFHITLESFFTGSRANDLTHSLTPAEKARHKQHVDEMYIHFKDAVMAGRGIHKDVIDLVAGGRVMTGLKAYALVGSEEVVEDVRDYNNVLELIEDVPADSTKAAKDPRSERMKNRVTLKQPPVSVEDVRLVTIDDTKVVEISEDQDTSPYAPPQPESNVIAIAKQPLDGSVDAKSSAVASQDAMQVKEADKEAGAQVKVGSSAAEAQGDSQSSTGDEAAIHAEQALSTATPQELRDSISSRQRMLFSFLDRKRNPFGRGLVDAVGGLADAATVALQFTCDKRLDAYMEEHPGVTPAQACQILFPGVATASVVAQNDEEVTYNIDVAAPFRLKQFPEQKSLWQQIREAAKRGDAMEVEAVMAVCARSAAVWLANVAHQVVANELNDLGLGQLAGHRTGRIGNPTNLNATTRVGLGNEARRGWLRAQWNPSSTI